MLGELVPCGGGDPIPLFKPKLLVGRQEFCDIRLRFANISSRHCELEQKKGYWFIRDLGSSNGIRVDGKRCESKFLMPGDEVWFARHRFNIHYEPQSDQPPPDAEGTYKEFQRSLLDKVGYGQEEKRSVRRSKSADHSLGELVPRGGGDPIPLVKTRLTIGRNPKCDVVLRSSAVSSRHCELEYDKGFWIVRDLGSRNGTRVDGAAIKECKLLPGSVLRIAKFRYEIDYEPTRTDSHAGKKNVPFVQSLLDKAGLNRRNK